MYSCTAGADSFTATAKQASVIAVHHLGEDELTLISRVKVQYHEHALVGRDPYSGHTLVMKLRQAQRHSKQAECKRTVLPSSNSVLL